MHAKKREIIGLFLTAFVLLTAVGIVLHKLQEKKQTNETDLYSLMASSPHAVISIHHPARFTNEILASEAARKLFASFIPPVFLSVMPHIHAPLLLSFHQQGAVLYVQADAASAKQLEKTAAQSFDAFAPQRQQKEGLTFTFYPDTNNRFFGCYYHDHVWVASFSKKLLEEVAQNQMERKTGGLLAEQPFIRRSLDANVPLNILFRTDMLDLHVTRTDSTKWTPPSQWMGAELFLNENRLHYLSYLAGETAPADSLYAAALGDTLAWRFTQRFPHMQVVQQSTWNDNQIFYNGYFQPSDKQ